MSETNDRASSPPDKPPRNPRDHVFRFRIDPSAEKPVYDDPLIELIRGQLADLLDAVILTDHGRRVRIDGFRLLQEPESQYEIFPQSAEADREERGK